MKQLAGRVAVVTGAASGIGRATASALAARGVTVALVDLDEAGLDETAALLEKTGAKTSVHRADVSDRARMEGLPEEVLRVHGHVHVVVNNAGVTTAAPTLEHSLDDYEWVIGVNLLGVIYGSKVFLPHLLREDEAHVVNVSSMFGFVGIPAQSSYCATKFAVRGFTESLWCELRGTSVGVTSVHPGGIRTGIVSNAHASDDEAKSALVDAFERFGAPPESVARGILRGILRRKLRVIVRPEAYLAEWSKRLLPVTTQRLIARVYHRQSPAAIARLMPR